MTEAPCVMAEGEATHIEVDATVRYWEDTLVNGVEDVDGKLIPGRVGDDWRVRIALATGEIVGWPADTTAAIHYKVCDEGLYWLTDAGGARLARWRGHYAPDDFLCPGTDGFGDYIILNVGADGRIEGWERPAIDLARWEPIAALAKAEGR